MAKSDFEEPLGFNTQPSAPDSAPLDGAPYRLVAFAGLGTLGLLLFSFVSLTGDPMGGEPYAIAAIHEEKLQPPPKQAAAPPAAAEDMTPTASISRRITTAEALEQQSGVKVVRTGADTPNALIITVPPDLSVGLSPAPDMRLAEKSRYGLLPKIGADGSQPSEIYARPLVSSGKLPANAPKIAILIGGMGLDPAATTKAVQSLPPAVTLGFAPYGNDLAKATEEARAKGHEIMLQVPMEPYDYPRNNPGPHTLVTGVSASETEDNLHWLMGRFTGYVGIANFLGARFTSDESALKPFLRELADRGLFYADDGTSAQSLGPTLAPEVGVKLARADITLTSDPDRLGADLLLLESKARDKGIAVGIASGLTLNTIERIARFAQALETKGINLVPLSSVAGKGRSMSAETRQP